MADYGVCAKKIYVEAAVAGAATDGERAGGAFDDSERAGRDQRQQER